MKKLYFFIFFVSVLIVFAQTEATETTIDTIIEKPGNFEGESVKVSGTVVQFVDRPSSTSYYILRSDYGVSIQVNTSEGSPETFEKYSVTGIVYIDQQTRLPFISEKDREKLTGDLINPNNWWIYAIILAALAGIGVLFYHSKSRGNKKPAPVPTPGRETSNWSEDIFSEDEQRSYTSSASKFKTVKITKNQPKTLKLIPGTFKFVTGEDTGKELKLAGYPTANGVLMTFGRDQVKGERENSHVQLGDQYITVSGKQCEIIYKGGDVFVKNLSNTNYTQIDGVEVEPNQKAKLTPGSIVKLGELEFEYIV